MSIIEKIQSELNERYNAGLVVDGSWGNLSKQACPDIKKVTKNNLVWLIQACLAIKGYDIELDGSYGNLDTSLTNGAAIHTSLLEKIGVGLISDQSL